MKALIRKATNIQFQNFAVIVIGLFFMLSTILAGLSKINLNQYLNCSTVTFLGLIFVKLCEINNNIKPRK